MKECLCTTCGHRFQHKSVGARLILAGTGALLGKAYPYGYIIGPLLGLAFGGEVDRIIEDKIDPKCPACGFVIRTLATVL